MCEQTRGGARQRREEGRREGGSGRGRDERAVHANALVEVGRVLVAADCRRPRCGDLLEREAAPIDALEPRVIFNLRVAVVHAPNSVRRFPNQKLRNQVLRDTIGEDGWVRDAHLDDACANRHLVRIVCRERRVPAEHLVDENAERPNVDSFAVALAEQQLRREVIWSKDVRGSESNCEQDSRKM